jgi:hypothetical protein
MSVDGLREKLSMLTTVPDVGEAVVAGDGVAVLPELIAEKT